MKTNGRLSTGYLVQGGRTLFEIVTEKVQKLGKHIARVHFVYLSKEASQVSACFSGLF